MQDELQIIFPDWESIPAQATKLNLEHGFIRAAQPSGEDVRVSFVK